VKLPWYIKMYAFLDHLVCSIIQHHSLKVKLLEFLVQKKAIDFLCFRFRSQKITVVSGLRSISCCCKNKICTELVLSHSITEHNNHNLLSSRPSVHATSIKWIKLRKRYSKLFPAYCLLIMSCEFLLFVSIYLRNRFYM